MVSLAITILIATQHNLGVLACWGPASNPLFPERHAEVLGGGCLLHAHTLSLSSIPQGTIQEVPTVLGSPAEPRPTTLLGRQQMLDFFVPYFKSFA